MTKSYLGVDLGATSIKIVELKNEGGRPRLLTYGYTEQTIGAPEKDFTETPARAIDLIKQVCAKAKIVSRQSIAALPTASVFSSILNIPAAGKNIAEAVQWEAKKIIPLPLEEMILDWKILDQGKTDAGSEGAFLEGTASGGTGAPPRKITRVLLTAAAKNLVKKYLDIFKGAGINLVSLETETFALIRSLVGIDKSNIVIVDMGAASTGIFIVENGVPFLNRSLNIGGFTITREIAAGLGMAFDQAEQLKFDVGMSLGPQGGASKIIERALSMLINEIKYCVNLYQSRDNAGGKRVEKIILTGGGAMMPNFADYLSEVLNMRTYIGNPWARVIYPEELKPILDQIGPKFAGAIGLAMREIEQ